MSVYDLLKKQSYMIGVPSRDRSFMIGKKTGVWKYLSEDYPLCLVVRESEAQGYHVALTTEFSVGCVKLVMDDATIAVKRNGLIEEAIRRGVDHLFILDDDVALYFRDENLSSKYTSRAEDFERMEAFDRILYECICLCNEKYPIVGLPLKQGSFNLLYTFPKNIPIIRFVCYHIPTLKKEGIKATGLNTTFMSDRFVHLSLLQKGYMGLSNCRWCVGDPGTGYRGGCSITRTVNLQEEAAKLLTQAFPEAVTLKMKENGLWSERRLDCSIKWKHYLPEGEQGWIPLQEGLDMIRSKGDGYDV